MRQQVNRSATLILPSLNGLRDYIAPFHCPSFSFHCTDLAVSEIVQIIEQVPPQFGGVCCSANVSRAWPKGCLGVSTDCESLKVHVPKAWTRRRLAELDVRVTVIPFHDLDASVLRGLILRLDPKKHCLSGPAYFKPGYGLSANSHPRYRDRV